MNRRRTLLFRNGSVHYSNKDAKGSSTKSDSSHIDIEVRTARLNRNTSKTYAEFELLISLRVRSKLGHAINQWSVFKRYSDISELNKRIRAQFGWQTEKITFPPKKMFGSLDPTFLEKRRGELDYYFSQVLALPDIADFKKHFSSQDLRRFIEYDANEKVKATAEKASAGEEKTGDDGSKSRRKKKSGSSRKSSNRRSRRRSRAREEGTASSRDKEAAAGASVPALEDAPAEASSAGAASSSGGGGGLGPEYAQFLSMQKAGVPEGAIRQKMNSMGVDPEPMFGGGSSGGGGARPPPPRPTVAPSGGRAPPPLPTSARGPPPMPPQKKAPAKKKPAGGGGGGRGGLLAAIQKGKMLKKTTTKEPKAPGETAAPSAPANPMMAAILARRKRVE